MPELFVGIDPSLRHTGIAIIRGVGRPTEDTLDLHEIETPGEGLVVDLRLIKLHLRRIIKEQSQRQEAPGKTTTPPNWHFAMERQLGTGRATPLLSCVQAAILDTLLGEEGSMWPKIALPLPVQLRSYMTNRHRFPQGTKRDTVRATQLLYPFLPKRLSSHKAEALMLAAMAQDIRNGEWAYNLPDKEHRLLPIDPYGGVRRKPMPQV